MSTEGVFAADERHKRMTKRVLWKLDSHILPPLALLWLANFIDRSNIGNARIAGLEEDTHLTGSQFNIVLAVFYVSYLLVELPSNWIMKKLKPDRWIPLLVFLWGFVTTMTCFAQNLGGLIAIRMCLGLCEGGLLPGIVLYLSTIYKRHELQLRVGIFYASASLSGAFGGLLATAIIKMDGVGGLAGWRWIFILEGIVTMFFSVIAWALMPTDIASAKFLTPEEREFALTRFKSDHSTPSLSVSAMRPVGGDLKTEEVAPERVTTEISEKFVVADEEQFEWREIKRGLIDIQTWLTGFAYFGFIVSLYSFSLFLPTIVNNLGYSGAQAQLHTVPPYVPAVVLTIVVAVFSDRLRWRGPFILICLPVAIVGYIVAITATTNTGRYVAVFLIATGIYPCGPCILSILPNNCSGHYKRATCTALQLAVANTGGFVATFSYTQDQAPKYIRGHSISLAFLCIAWLLILCNVLYCTWENRARERGSRQHNIEKYKALWYAGKTRAP